MTARLLPRVLALVAAGATFVAACGGSTATTAPTVAPPTVAPTVAAASSALPGFSFALPSGFNADKDLEALLPDSIAGETVTKLSMTGDSFMGIGQGTEDLQKVLDQFGKSPSDLSVAFGGTSKASIVAFRIKGVDGGKIFDAFAAAAGNRDVGSISDVTIAGKPAKKVVDSSGSTIYLYATGDAIITVTDANSALTDDLLQQIFQQFP
ncbi:MAG TPA: hypothetical protein VHR16_10765 [Candidatus Limnocylindrales bacterium]|jgi:hypothetical protein|nr:hypothetical protein [Candidatus Limnocylindrales bacterium]